jgi:hypothetical protein
MKTGLKKKILNIYSNQMAYSGYDAPTSFQNPQMWSSLYRKHGPLQTSYPLRSTVSLSVL